MTDKMHSKAINDMAGLLDQERELLLAGSFSKLGELADRKEELVEELAHLAQSAKGIPETLAARFRRNQTLLQSAEEGLRSVAARLDAVRDVQEVLNTYGAHGERTAFRPARSSQLERRA